MNFFLEKQLIRFSCTYQLAPFILQNFLKNYQSRYRVMRTHHCREQTYYYFHLPISPFHCANFKKSYSGSRVMRLHHFWVQNGPFAPNFFWKKIVNIIFIYNRSLSLRKNLENFLQQIQSYRMRHFWLKMVCLPK